LGGRGLYSEGGRVNSAVIRSAELKDAEGIAYVHVTVWQKTYPSLIPNSFLKTLSVEQRAKQWKQTLADDGNLYHPTLVAVIDRKVIGFANYGREREGDQEYQGELFAIYLLKQFQGRGVGRAMVQRVATGLLELSLMSMLVWVLSDNPYQKFYERLGGIYLREKPIQIGDVLLMEKAYGWKDIRPLMEGSSLV